MRARCVAIFVLALLTSASAAPSIAYLCRITGEVSSGCCCESSDSPVDLDVVRAESGCCDVMRYEELPPAISRAEKLTAPPAAVAVPPVTELVLVPLLAAPARHVARAPPLIREPLFVLHCTYLI